MPPCLRMFRACGAWQSPRPNLKALGADPRGRGFSSPLPCCPQKGPRLEGTGRIPLCGDLGSWAGKGGRLPIMPMGCCRPGLSAGCGSETLGGG